MNGDERGHILLAKQRGIDKGTSGPMDIEQGVAPSPLPCASAFGALLSGRSGMIRSLDEILLKTQQNT